ncbi:MAG: hypothetical protein GW779_03635 [Candidatus Altiarchaeum hamiconexum]|uniref:Carbonic anhydrase n=1 Tax=Candidatus Altarchaeum hamiconexum TaxID=1803513 RepID=A0A8J7YUL6_9ARCH|nr:hypothetical protein [Candidatus Altarchaeum hamiconexum]PIN67709.1 MAG: hypothetical protein COV98_01845 [Candidatus Altarchaeum sp. CG12_big_fil_rev_8_21_14_0_65_33_22]PIV28765.1 MAG: hypothetical protein COS36_01130 [Candidatus Altarchaeum sp. CG03_land_8_20_14_0_80_32_618]PIX48217.1 MAG: hypothetical protein COZ53_04740 [Candidatus Altarchaeum sp. CG_4_8_14_3_um_filter_33_2054]PIZ29254.1 MAG: hypothetical protein COY41_06275 [Candidatus Altarchaeum sp. CG_4_10_14_0_8_um_filter_32_851]PJ
MKHSKIVEEIVNRNDNYVKKHTEHYFTHHIASQHPIITLVSCSDSRVQPNVLIENPHSVKIDLGSQQVVSASFVTHSMD